MAGSEAGCYGEDIGKILNPTFCSIATESPYYGLSRNSTDVYVATIDPAAGECLEPPTKAIRRFEGRNSEPIWSPDGKSLAYVSLRHLPGISGHKVVWASGSLVIRSLETGEEREIIIKSPAAAHWPSWSPDGRYILCAAGGGSHLSRIDVQTGHVTFIIERDPNSWLANWRWSPDGKAIFYSKITEKSRSIVMHDLETGEEKELYKEVHMGALAVSPDGRELAFINGRAIMVMSTEGGEPRELLRLQDTERIRIAPAFTPDGHYVLFVKRTDDQPLMELWRIPAEGGEPQKLLEMDGMADMSIHPDGRRIAFTKYGPSPSSGIWAMENFLPGFTANE